LNQLLNFLLVRERAALRKNLLLVLADCLIVPAIDVRLHFDALRMIIQEVFKDGRYFLPVTLRYYLPLVISHLRPVLGKHGPMFASQSCARSYMLSDFYAANCAPRC